MRICAKTVGKPHIFVDGGHWDWWPNGCYNAAFNSAASEFCWRKKFK